MHGHVLPQRAVIEHKRALLRARSRILANETLVFVVVAREDLLHALDFLDASQSIAQSHDSHFLDSRELLVAFGVKATSHNRHFPTPAHL